jgi:hypothetical protein
MLSYVEHVAGLVSLCNALSFGIADRINVLSRVADRKRLTNVTSRL